MNLSKFRITNYKSIVDSGYCTLASDVTILIGKNESGKTAMLEALRDFDQAVGPIPAAAVPLDGLDVTPRIELIFRLQPTELDQLLSQIGITMPEEFSQRLKTEGLSIVKTQSGEYELGDEVLKKLLAERNSNQSEERVNRVKSAKERLSTLMDGRPLPDITPSLDNDELQRRTRELSVLVKSYLPTLKDEQKQNSIVEALRVILQSSAQFHQTPSNPATKFLAAVKNLLPRFVFFSEFTGAFPFAIPITQIKEVEQLRNFATISGLDLSKVIDTQDIQKRINLLNRHTAIFNSEFSKFWQQNHLEIIVKPEGDMILFGAKERDRTDIFKIDQRSKGFQWFLSFYLRLSTQKSSQCIILIDEPGVNLHAKAQREILKILVDKIAPESPVIISTHSPYLLETTRLDRVRLVLKDTQRGTLVSNHITKDADADTLLPIATTLKMETASATPLSGKCNVLIFDAADYFFLAAVQSGIKNPEGKEINLIPCTGEDGNLEQLVSFLKGFNFDFRVVFNRASENYAKKEYLQKKFDLSEKQICFVPLDPHAPAVEDLIAYTDFYAYVVAGETPQDHGLLNSQFLEIHGIDRLQAAKHFQQQTRSNSTPLSHATLDAFQKTLDRVIQEEEPVALASPQITATDILQKTSLTETVVTETITTEEALNPETPTPSQTTAETTTALETDIVAAAPTEENSESEAAESVTVLEATSGKPAPAAKRNLWSFLRNKP